LPLAINNNKVYPLDSVASGAIFEKEVPRNTEAIGILGVTRPLKV
jgi:hypothetical protein